MPEEHFWPNGSATRRGRVSTREVVMNTLGFGIVGCGRICEKHLQSITNQDRARLVAVCDTAFERARAIGEKYGVPAYPSVEEMLSAEPSIDIADVLTPSGDHAETSINALRSGKHVLVEKPMALTLEDAERMVLAADEMGKRLFIVKQNRYNRPVVKLREYFEAGRFGRIVMGSVRVRWCRTQQYYDQDDWRGTWRWDGGVLTNQASHHIDLLQWFLGEPVSVYATSRTALVDIETEDTAAAIIQFASGAIGIVEATTATRPTDLEGSLSILGERGTVVLGGFAVNKVDTWNFADCDDNEEVSRDLSNMPPNVYGFGHEQVIQNVCESLSHQKKALVEGFEGIKSLRLINGFYESIETGKPVQLAFRPKRCRLGTA
jgi:UDP-N-acetyl-2-amino-2-deoxyglucuronate dehydrogenase